MFTNKNYCLSFFFLFLVFLFLSFTGTFCVNSFGDQFRVYAFMFGNQNEPNFAGVSAI